MLDFFWSLSGRLLNAGFATVFSIVLGNLLLPQDLGIYVSVMLLLNYAISLTTLGVDVGVVQRLNDQNLKSKQAHYFSVGWILISIIAILIMICLLLGLNSLLKLFNLENQATLVVAFFPLIFLRMTRNYFERVLQASLQFKALTVINALAAVVQLIITILLIFLGYHLFSVLAGLYLSSLIAVISQGYLAVQKYGFVLTLALIDVGKDLLKFGGLIHLSTVAAFSDKNIDLFFINYFMPKSDVAIYNYATQIMLLLLILGHSISATTFPRFSQLFSSPKAADISRIYSLSLNGAFVGLSAIVVILVFHLEYLIPLILPSFYLSMITSLTILLVGILIFATFASVGTIFTAKGIPGQGTIINWFALGVNILLNLQLVPTYGLIGAAIATTITFIIRAVATTVLIERKIQPAYNHIRLFLIYAVLAGAIFMGRFWVQSLLLRELMIFIIIVLNVLLLFGHNERTLIKQTLPKLQFVFRSLRS